MIASHHGFHRPAFDIGSVARKHLATLWENGLLSREQAEALDAIAACRTSALGGHVDECPNCGFGTPSYNSCRNRHCPRCQTQLQQEWVEAQTKRMLPVHHYHLVFTMPAELRCLTRDRPLEVISAFFDCIHATLFELAETHGGVVPGMTVVLHTWTKKLLYHPHAHVIMTAGGLRKDGSGWGDVKYKCSAGCKKGRKKLRHGKPRRFVVKWKGKAVIEALKKVAEDCTTTVGRAAGKPVLARRKFKKVPTADKETQFLFPVRVMGQLLRGKMLAALNALHAENAFEGHCAFEDPEGFDRLMRQLASRAHWNVHAESALNYVENVVNYLGRYVTRVAISNSRIVDVTDDAVVFTAGQETVKLTPIEFLTRFAQHVLPMGLRKIRHYGLYASASSEKRELVRRILLDTTDAASMLHPRAASSPGTTETSPSQKSPDNIPDSRLPADRLPFTETIDIPPTTRVQTKHGPHRIGVDRDRGVCYALEPTNRTVGCCPRCHQQLRNYEISRPHPLSDLPRLRRRLLGRGPPWKAAA